MKISSTAKIWTSVVALVAAGIAFIVILNWYWYGSPDQIEAYLLKSTPLGSSEEQVMAHLRKSGARFHEPWRGTLEPNKDYPGNTIAGSSFIGSVVAEYTIIFSTSVEAFYIFDSSRRLVEVVVRTSTDAP